MSARTEKFIFGNFKLDPAKRILFRERAEVKLRDKDFDVLFFLIESAPKTCSHDKIIETVWDGTYVGNSSVDKAITNIRKVLGDDSKTPRFIKTVRSKGYLFIGDVRSSEDSEPEYLSEPLIDKLDSQIVNQDKDDITRIKENSRFPYVLISLAVLMIFTAVGIYLVRTFVFDSLTEPQVLFADDFSAEEIDLQKWQPKGKTIRTTDGNALVTIDETDKGGQLWSSYFSYNPAKPIIISSRLKFNPNKNYGKYYFGGEFFMIPKVFSKEQSGVVDFDWIKKATLAFGVIYEKYEHESETEVSTEGFFLIKPGGRPAEKYSQKAGTISKAAEPVWNRWFEQKIIYNPTTGVMEYFIDGEEKIEFNVGQLPPLDENKMQLQITPYGWYTNHSMEIDYISVMQ
jgi:DNA-binding winged helix-turn-helix (wHTH) protein